MADSDKADKQPATRPTVKGAGAPTPESSGPTTEATSSPGGARAKGPAGSGQGAPAAPRPAVKQPASHGGASKPAPAKPAPAKPAPAAAAPAPATAAPKAQPAPAVEQTRTSGTPVTERAAAPVGESRQRSITAGRAPGSNRRPRRARLRLTRIDPLSVMKVSFLLSVAFGIVTFVAVFITWSVLGAAGVWDSVNQTVGTIVTSGESESTFDIRDYVGMGRVLGFTLIVAVVDVVLLTAMATLSAFLYNMAASLLGGVEVTLSEDDH